MPWIWLATSRFNVFAIVQWNWDIFLEVFMIPTCVSPYFFPLRLLWGWHCFYLEWYSTTIQWIAMKWCSCSLQEVQPKTAASMAVTLSCLAYNNNIRQTLSPTKSMLKETQELLWCFYTTSKSKEDVFQWQCLQYLGCYLYWDNNLHSDKSKCFGCGVSSPLCLSVYGCFAFC